MVVLIFHRKKFNASTPLKLFSFHYVTNTFARTKFSFIYF